MVSQAAFSLVWAERYAQVRPLLDASIAQARATGDSGRLALGLAIRGWLALRRGDLGAAEADARTALAATELPAPPMYRVLNGGVLVKTLVDQGELDAAEEALAPLDAEAESGFVTGAVLRLARGRLRVEQGRSRTGSPTSSPSATLLTRAHVTCPSYPAVALGGRARPSRARRPRVGADASQKRSSSSRGHSARRARSASRNVPPASSPAATGESSCFGRRSTRSSAVTPGWNERARSPTSARCFAGAIGAPKRASCCARRSTPPTARAPTPLAEHAETELRATGARPRRVVLTGLDSLTASERRVAEFASQGLTNREIAQTLFVTARTVEGHLTSVFRKLQLDSRNELPAALAGGSSVPT